MGDMLLQRRPLAAVAASADIRGVTVVVLVGVVLIFKNKFKDLMDGQMNKLSGKITQFE